MPTPILFIPGFMQPASAWGVVAEQLDPPTTLLDHHEHSFEGRLAEIAAAGEGALLVGYSLGGRLALRAALRDPARYAGLVTVGRRPGVPLPRLLLGLGMLIAVPMAIGSLPIPGPVPGMEDRAGDNPFLLDELRGPARDLLWQMRLGSALPGLFLASAYAVHLARRERRAAEASGDPVAIADSRRVLAGAGLLLFSVGGMLVEALAYPRLASAIRWGIAARTGWDLWLPFVLMAVVPAVGCVAGFALGILHGYHAARWEDGRPAGTPAGAVAPGE